MFGVKWVVHLHETQPVEVEIVLFPIWTELLNPAKRDCPR